MNPSLVLGPSDNIQLCFMSIDMLTCSVWWPYCGCKLTTDYIGHQRAAWSWYQTQLSQIQGMSWGQLSTEASTALYIKVSTGRGWGLRRSMRRTV